MLKAAWWVYYFRLYLGVTDPFIWVSYQNARKEYFTNELDCLEHFDKRLCGVRLMFDFLVNVHQKEVYHFEDQGVAGLNAENADSTTKEDEKLQKELILFNQSTGKWPELNRSEITGHPADVHGRWMECFFVTWGTEFWLQLLRHKWSISQGDYRLQTLYLAILYHIYENFTMCYTLFRGDLPCHHNLCFLSWSNFSPICCVSQGTGGTVPIPSVGVRCHPCLMVRPENWSVGEENGAGEKITVSQCMIHY